MCATAMSARVACVGIAVLDRIFGVDELPSGDIKLRASRYHESGGGMAAGAAVGIARLGGRASWFGRLGADRTGDEVLSALAGHGVDIRHALRVDGASTGHAAVLVDPHGNRAIVACAAGGLPGTADWLDLDALSDHDAVLADLRWQAGAAAALGAARAARRPGILDADSMATPDSHALVALASHTVFSLQGLHDFYGSGSIEQGLRQASAGGGFVAVTLGADGVAWLDAGTQRIEHLPAPAIDAHETLGAGDLFHGAFALALAEGRAEREALAFAVMAASIKCERMGGWASFPDRAEVKMRQAGKTPA